MAYLLLMGVAIGCFMGIRYCGYLEGHLREHDAARLRARLSRKR